MKPLTKAEKKVLEKVGAKFKELRIKEGYKSYETFAFDKDINRMQYWRLEKGMSNLSLVTLVRMLEVHKMTLQEFFNELE